MKKIIHIKTLSKQGKRLSYCGLQCRTGSKGKINIRRITGHPNTIWVPLSVYSRGELFYGTTKAYEVCPACVILSLPDRLSGS